MTDLGPFGCCLGWDFGGVSDVFWGLIGAWGMGGSPVVSGGDLGLFSASKRGVFGKGR